MHTNYWAKYLDQRLNRRRALAVGGSALAASALLVACGSNDDGGDNGTDNGAVSAPAQGKFSPSDGTPQPGGRLEVTVTTVPSFNLVAEWAEANGLGGMYVYDRPFSTREDQRRFVLEAMDSVELKDPLTLVMKLKPGQTFQNVAPVSGRKVTAADIVATQEYAKALTNNFDKTFVLNYLDRAEATDELTVVYHLKKPNAYLFGTSGVGSNTGQVIIPKETFDNLNTGTQIGSGPFMVKSAQVGSDYVYTQNPTFRGRSKGFPYINEVHAIALTDSAANEAAYRGGRLDVWGGVSPNPTQVKSLQSESSSNIHVMAGLNAMTFVMQMTKGRPWQSDVRLREAFWRLTNRQQILDLAYGGFGDLPSGEMTSGLTQYQPDAADTAPFWKEDIQKAKQLLSAASWDKSKTYDLVTRGGGAVDEAVSQVWQKQLQRGEIETNVVAVLGEALFQRQRDNEWDVRASTPPATDSPFQMIRMQHSASWSDTYRNFGLMDPEIDAMIEKSEQTTDFEENRRMVIQIQLECMKRFSSVYFMLTPNASKVLSKRVQNWDLTQVNVPQHQAWLKA